MKKIFFALLLSVLLSITAFAADGEPMRIAVIDSGISTAAVSADSIANGINYIRPQDDLEDKLGHGTAVSAIILGSEPARIEGICPTATLVPLVTASRDDDGKQVRGDTAMTAQAIYDAIDIYGCRIINISAGSSGGSERLRKAVEYAEEKGVLVISSAGNNQSSNPGAIYYPGGYESAISVGACTDNGTIAAFSQQNDTVDLLALGIDLRLASVKGTRIRGEGTSFATAIVTGAAAQIWTQYPALTADEVRDAVLSSTRAVDGWWVLDLQAALAWSPESAAPVFQDVAPGAYYYDAVRWAVERRVTAGVSDTAFAPEQVCTQAQILTFLWRANGMPMSAGGHGYTDAAVQLGTYFYEALCWAQEVGIVLDPALDPNAPCSRADVVTYLWRLSGSPEAEAAAFADVAVEAPYASAVDWAVAQNITKGVSATEFGPDTVCSRGQIVTFLHRYFAE